MEVAPAGPSGEEEWELYRVIAQHTGWVKAVAVDPTNTWFATGSADSSIKIWDLADGGLELSLTGHLHGITGLEFDTRHPYLFSVGDDKMVKCWDLEKNSDIRSYFGHKSAVYALALHPELDILFTGGRDKVVRVWDMRSRNAIGTLTGHTEPIFSLIAQGAEPQVVSGSGDSTVRLWDIRKMSTSSILTHHRKTVRALVHSPVDYAFVSAAGKSIKRFGCPDGDLLSSFKGRTHTTHALALNDDGLMVAAGEGSILSFYNYYSGSLLQSIRVPLQTGSLEGEACIFDATFDRSGTRLITVEADKSIKMFRPKKPLASS